MGLRLATGEVTVLLGSSVGRRRVMNRLDDTSGRCADGHGADVVRLGTRADDPAGDRLAALAAAGRATLVLVDRLTDGLTAQERRTVLAAVRSVAHRGAAVLVDDTDPVAALAFADQVVRASHTGEVTAGEPVCSAYSAS